MYAPSQPFDDFDSPARAKVLAALAEDARSRYPGVTEGLYGIGSLAPFARLGHGVPVVRHSSRWEGFRPLQFARAASDAEFRDRLSLVAPFLASFDLAGWNLCLAGGSVSALLMNPGAKPDETFHDYDLFLVGHLSDSHARASILRLGQHLYAQWGGEGHVEVFRTKGCLTFRRLYPEPPASSLEPTETPLAGDTESPAPTRKSKETLVQVILRRYATPAEVIHGFDLGSSAVLWDGSEVRTTALGKLAFENGANVLNLAARRGSYERRLARYFRRGFDLVLPDLSGLEFLKAEGRLPYLFADGLKCRGGCACDLWAHGLYATRPGCDSYGRAPGHASWDAPPEETSDYEAGDIVYASGVALSGRNARALGGEKVWTESLCAHALVKPGIAIFDLQPTVDPGDLAELVFRAFRTDAVRVKSLVSYLGNAAAAGLLSDYLAARGSVSRDAVSKAAAARCAELEKLAAGSLPFAFMAVEDKTALTGPFPRSLVTDEQWYGEALNTH